MDNLWQVGVYELPAKSLAFARMKAALLALVTDIPPGKVAQVGDIALALNIPPRHVAYILSQLHEDEAAFVPWHRVVPAGGKFPIAAKRSDRQNRQIDALHRDGLDYELTDFSLYIWSLPDTHKATFWADED
jgi:methylated-DNA-protein-cysteine methyltransferase related protein